MDHDLVARLPPRDPWADLPDDPRRVGAADVVAPLGVVAVVEDRDRLAEGRPDVVEVDAGGHDAHDHLERARLGKLDLLDLEGVLRLALALLADDPCRHRLGQLARLDVELGNVLRVYGHGPPSRWGSEPRILTPCSRQVSVGRRDYLRGSDGSIREATAQPRFEPPSDGIVRVLDDRLVIEGLTISDERAARVVRERAEAGQRPADTVTQGGRDRRARPRQRGDRRQRGLRSRRAWPQPRRGQPGARRAGRRRHRRADRADRRQLRPRAGRLGAGADQGDRRRRGARAARGPDRHAHRRGRRRTRSSRFRRGLGRPCSTPRSATAERSSCCARRTEGGARDARPGRRAPKEIARMLEREDADERVAEAEEAGTRKGFTFEERVDAAIERIAAARGRLRHPHRRRGRRGRWQKGRHARRARSGRRTGRRAGSSSSPRTSGFPRTTPGGAQRGDGCACRRLRGARRRRRGPRSGGARAAPGVRGQQADRRRRSRRARRPGAGPRLPPGGRARVDGARPRPHGRRRRGSMPSPRRRCPASSRPRRFARRSRESRRPPTAPAQVSTRWNRPSGRNSSASTCSWPRPSRRRTTSAGLRQQQLVLARRARRPDAEEGSSAGRCPGRSPGSHPSSGRPRLW